MGDPASSAEETRMICCVTGMHRSGTSLLAQWLAKAGLPLASGGTIAADISNPLGYVEDLDFIRLHAAHLRRIRKVSCGWKLAPPGFLHLDESESSRAREIIARRDASHPSWGWKDPRSILFLPDWKRLIPDLKVIIVWRPCADVVFSLLKRGCKQRRAHLLITPLMAVRMWRAHNRLACEYRNHYPDETLIVDAATLPRAGAVLRDRLKDGFGLPLEAVSLADLFAPEIFHAAPGWLRRCCSASGCSSLEADLRALSIGPG